MELEELKSTWKKLDQQMIQNKSESKKLILKIIKENPKERLNSIFTTNTYMLPVSIVSMLKNNNRFKINILHDKKHSFIIGLISLFVMLPKGLFDNIQNIQLYIIYICAALCVAVCAAITFYTPYYSKNKA